MNTSKGAKTDPRYFLESVTDFTETLAHAIYDRNLENTSGKKPTIRYYYDADVVVRMVLGFRSEPKRGHPREMLTRALLSAGYLGKMHLLRPHAAELYGVLRRQQDQRASYSEDVQLYLKQHGVDQDFQSLLAAIREGQTEEEKTGKFLEVLREVGADTFVALQLTYGAWEERLRLLNNRVLRFSDLGPEVRPLLNAPDTWKIYDVIAKYRVSRHVPINDLTDAVSVLILRRMIVESSQSGVAPMVRFHTNSALQKIVRNEQPIRELLSYDVPDQWKIERSWNAGVVLRKTEYFIMRACFEALRMPDSDLEVADDGGPPPVSVSELERVLRELTHALKDREKTDERAVHKRLEKLMIGDRQLDDVIADIQQASFLERLFTRYRAPESLRALVADAEAVFHFMNTGVPRRQLRKEIERDAESLKSDLALQVSEFYERMEFVRDVSKRVFKLLGKDGPQRTEFAVTDPLRDLGLIRWGGNIDENDLQYAATMMGKLFDTNPTASLHASTDLVRDALEELDESRCLVICGVLWTLSLFERVILTINGYDRHLKPGEIEASLAIMRTAARARVGPPFSTPEKQHHMFSLEGEIARSTGPYSDRQYIGLAYAAYYVSISDGEHLTGGVKGEGEDGALTRAPWAVQSYRYGEKAVSLLESSGDRRGLAFAINHCAYVGTVLSIFEERTRQYVQRVQEFKHERVVENGKEHSLWHYRFADTIAMAEYRLAYSNWERSLLELEGTTANTLRAQTCERLSNALELLATAPPKFGDPEIQEHIGEIQRLQVQ